MTNIFVTRIRREAKRNKKFAWTTALVLFAIDFVINTLFGRLIELAVGYLLSKTSIALSRDYYNFGSCVNAQFTTLLTLPEILSSGIAGLTEENSKFIAAKIGILKQYLTLFNAVEFSVYVSKYLRQRRFTIERTLYAVLKDSIARIMVNVSEIRTAGYLKDVYNAIISHPELKKLFHNIDKIHSVPQETFDYKADVSKKDVQGAKRIIMQALEVDPEKLIKFTKELAKEAKKEKLQGKDVIVVILVRLLGVLGHILSGWLHRRGKHAFAVLFHIVHNILFATLIQCAIQIKFDEVLKRYIAQKLPGLRRLITELNLHFRYRDMEPLAM